VDPKLRLIANGSFYVNRIRSELSASVTVKSRKAIKEKVMRTQNAVPVDWKDLDKKVDWESVAEVTPDILANVFVELAPSGQQYAERKIPGEIARKGNAVTAMLPLSELEGLIKDSSVLHVEIGQQLRLPEPSIADVHATAPDVRIRRVESELNNGGEGILIGIIDVQGFDFAHSDFLDENGKTRFLSIWDQGGSRRSPPKRFKYGAEIKKEDMDAALKNAPDIGVPPQRLEPQSQMIPGSHGTHVASIAAGNSGICPKAHLVGVLVSLTEEDMDRRKSFYDSVNIAHAVDYILDVAEKLGKDVPVSINISLGTNGHAHDGSASVCRWIDSELTMPGKCVCVAVGNAGQEKPETEGDYGFIMGRIHTSGIIPAKGLTKDLEWVVVGNGIADISENELEIWYGAQDRFSVSIKPPGMDWIKPSKIYPGEFIENRQLNNGSLLSVYNELYHQANGANYISIYLSPFYSDRGVVGVLAGKWIIRLHGEEIREGSYHGWIERDDPRKLGRIGSKEAWNFPSFFSANSSVDCSSINSLACGNLVLAVANMDTKADKVNMSSSQGPTRDGRSKPEIAAPGTDIIAAKGFSNVDDPWISMTGTSMASPYVCGVAGLMLAVEKKLTAAQIIGIVMRTSRPVPGSDYDWQNDAGFGLIDTAACLNEAKSINKKEDRT
jgi:subtilisin family serine protease